MVEEKGKRTFLKLKPMSNDRREEPTIGWEKLGVISFHHPPPPLTVFSNLWFSAPVHSDPLNASPHGRFAHALSHHILYIAWGPSLLKLTCMKEDIFELSPVFR